MRSSVRASGIVAATGMALVLVVIPVASASILASRPAALLAPYASLTVHWMYGGPGYSLVTYGTGHCRDHGGGLWTCHQHFENEAYSKRYNWSAEVSAIFANSTGAHLTCVTPTNWSVDVAPEHWVNLTLAFQVTKHGGTASENVTFLTRFS